MRISLTSDEIEALHATAGNIDPCMFDDMDDADGVRLSAAWTSGVKKLGDALETINARKIVAKHQAKKRP